LLEPHARRVEHRVVFLRRTEGSTGFEARDRPARVAADSANVRIWNGELSGPVCMRTDAIALPFIWSGRAPRATKRFVIASSA
jgi:hypothetical protein